jgi:transposase
MAKPRLQVKGYSPEDIQNLISKDERYTLGFRLHVVYNVARGYSSRMLEELVGFSFKQITNWVHRFEKDGIEGLRDKPKTGRRKRLSEEQLQRLSALLKMESPTGYGYNSDTWTGPLIADWIEKHFQVTFKKAQIYNIIHSLGFTYQRTKGIYPEANPAKKEVFKEALKKTSFES